MEPDNFNRSIPVSDISGFTPRPRSRKNNEKETFIDLTHNDIPVMMDLDNFNCSIPSPDIPGISPRPRSHKIKEKETFGDLTLNDKPVKLIPDVLDLTLIDPGFNHSEPFAFPGIELGPVRSSNTYQVNSNCKANKHKIPNEENCSPNKMTKTEVGLSDLKNRFTPTKIQMPCKDSVMLNPRSTSNVTVSSGTVEYPWPNYLISNHTITSADVESPVDLRMPLKAKQTQPAPLEQLYLDKPDLGMNVPRPTIFETSCHYTKKIDPKMEHKGSKSTVSMSSSSCGDEHLDRIGTDHRQSGNINMLSSKFDRNLASVSTKQSFYETQVNQEQVGMTEQNKAPIDVSKEPDEDRFYQLLEIFPDIDREYLKNQCRSRLDIEQITADILELNNNYPKLNLDPNEAIKSCTREDVHADRLLLTPEVMIKNESPQILNLQTALQEREIDNNVSKKPIESKLEFLLGIFPDADPSFLETKSELEENKLKDFIALALENKDYPKLNIKIEVDDDSEEKLIYTTNFDLEQFLKIFPEPFNYFYDENRVSYLSGHAMNFLKQRYRKHSVITIRKAYKQLGYNLIKTCLKLDGMQPTLATKRTINKQDERIEEVNMSVLQEACFIEHEAEIKAYMDSKAAAKELVFQEAKEKGELIECGCCFDEVLFEDCVACDEGDLFCKTCVNKSVEVRVGDGCTTFPCLLDCGAMFSLHLLQNLLDSRLFSKLLQRVQFDEVRSADIEGLEVCPFCEFATIPPPDTNIFKCLYPECLKESCRKCHRVNHIPQRCEELESDEQAKARKYIEDEMTRALVRECYKCKKSFIKMDGCNKMTCTCGAKMCYICREPIHDYKHFNGPGGSEKTKCPLYSTEKVLHVDAVQAVAKKALAAVTMDKPDLRLKHDPTKILPTASSTSTNLPAGANDLPGLIVRLQQVHERVPVEGQQRGVPDIQPAAGAINLPGLILQLQQVQGRVRIARRGRRGVPGIQPEAALAHHIVNPLPPVPPIVNVPPAVPHIAPNAPIAPNPPIVPNPPIEPDPVHVNLEINAGEARPIRDIFRFRLPQRILFDFLPFPRNHQEEQ